MSYLYQDYMNIHVYYTVGFLESPAFQTRLVTISLFITHICTNITDSPLVCNLL